MLCRRIPVGTLKTDDVQLLKLIRLYARIRTQQLRQVSQGLGWDELFGCIALVCRHQSRSYAIRLTLLGLNGWRAGNCDRGSEKWDGKAPGLSIRFGINDTRKGGWDSRRPKVSLLISFLECVCFHHPRRGMLLVSCYVIFVGGEQS